MLSARRTVREALVVGLIAYAAVAVFYTVFDLLAARSPLFTVDILGKAVFRGLRDPSVLQFPIGLDFTAIFLYDVLHLVIALAIGFVVTLMIDEIERRPARAGLIVAALVLGGPVTVLVVGVLSEPIRPLLPWWSIVVANALAALLGGVYLFRQRPVLRRYLSLSQHHHQAERTATGG